MTTLTIRRIKNFLGRRQTYKIWIDGKIIGTIKNDETIKIDIEPGTHTIQTGINKLKGMSKAELFEAIDGQTLEYTISQPRLSSIIFIIVILLVAASGINIHTSSYIFVLILLILVLILIFLASKFLIHLNRTN